MNRIAGDRSLSTAIATFVGAVILIGLPVATVLEVILGAAAETLGLSPLTTPPGSVLVYAVSILFGVVLAAEVTALFLGGIDALGRGSPRTARVRYLVFTVAVTSVLVGAIWAGAVLVREDPQSIHAALGALVALVALFVLVRFYRAFIDGMHASGG